MRFREKLGFARLATESQPVVPAMRILKRRNRGKTAPKDGRPPPPRGDQPRNKKTERDRNKGGREGENATG